MAYLRYRSRNGEIVYVDERFERRRRQLRAAGWTEESYHVEPPADIPARLIERSDVAALAPDEGGSLFAQESGTADGEQEPAGGEQEPAGDEQEPAGGEQEPADGEQEPADGKRTTKRDRLKKSGKE